MVVFETARLSLRRLDPEDASFIRRLLNEPSFIRYIGDRGVRSEDDARRYIADGPIASYARHGFGLYLVAVKPGGEPAGICGLLKRDFLDDVDLGFAFLPEYWSMGYGSEASAAVLADADRRGVARVLAITSHDNEASIRLLLKLGFVFERAARYRHDQPEVMVFVRLAVQPGEKLHPRLELR